MNAASHRNLTGPRIVTSEVYTGDTGLEDAAPPPSAPNGTCHGAHAHARAARQQREAARRRASSVCSLDCCRRLRRQFPALQDEVALTEVMEEAGRRIASREERGGPIEKLHGYAWVTVRSVATSHMRRGSIRLIQKTLDSEASHAQIAVRPGSVRVAPSRSSGTSCCGKCWRRSRRKSGWSASGRRPDSRARRSRSFRGARWSPSIHSSREPSRRSDSALGYKPPRTTVAQPKAVNGQAHEPHARRRRRDRDTRWHNTGQPPDDDDVRVRR